jgi:hypothetical protein
VPSVEKSGSKLVRGRQVIRAVQGTQWLSRVICYCASRWARPYKITKGVHRPKLSFHGKPL